MSAVGRSGVSGSMRSPEQCCALSTVAGSTPFKGVVSPWVDSTMCKGKGQVAGFAASFKHRVGPCLEGAGRCGPALEVLTSDLRRQVLWPRRPRTSCLTQVWSRTRENLSFPPGGVKGEPPGQPSPRRHPLYYSCASPELWGDMKF